MDKLGRRTKSVISLLALGVLVGVLSAVPAVGQSVPVEPPLAASSNVHLLAHIPGSAAGMNFADHYAYVSGWGASRCSTSPSPIRRNS